ncbi:translation elongation factor 4 [Patescibacteria group bacterium]|nr:translation elongation factor 4 [Patescibacteria group bacterium]
MSINQQNIRNFCIISHIDHGKSTLADRFLEITGTIEQREMRKQFLDTMDLEREKGITIKLQPVRMKYNEYVLNLIDTPGHVDFTYEVSRSLAAVEGAILLVDASQGIQAQTLANLHLAQEQNLIIIPVINKIDLSHAQVEESVKELSQLLKIDEKDILRISAKQGTNIEQVLKAVIEKIPAPKGNIKDPLRALIFDSIYDSYKGVVAFIRVVDGQVKAWDRIKMKASGKQADIIEVGVFRPQLSKTDMIQAGEVAYIATGLKELDQCRVGDTIISINAKTESLPGYKEIRPVVFASFYPAETDNHDLLKDSLAKLRLSDAALQYEPESCEGLGRGFRCGFLGMLHLEIILERLKREYNLNLVVTSPSVSYQIIDKKENSFIISSPEDLPEPNQITETKEPWADLEIIAPNRYLGQVMKLLEGIRNEYKDTQYLSPERVLIKYQAPLNEIIIDFYDKLKNTTAGYASMSYEVADYRSADLVKLDILIAGEKTEAFSRIVHKQRLEKEARALVKRLKEVIPKQLFNVALQAVVGGKVIARETISAMRKDVTGYLYGGDYTRKKKLLEKQKKGKKKMKAIGKVNIPQEVFLKVLRK